MTAFSSHTTVHSVIVLNRRYTQSLAGEASFAEEIVPQNFDDGFLACSETTVTFSLPLWM